MLHSEVIMLLALAAQFDGRKVDDATAEAWAQVIDLYVPDMTYDEAVIAVKAYYGGNSAWFMPNMLIELVRKRRAVTRDNRTGTDAPARPRSELGYRIISEILRRGRAAGSDPRAGRRIGQERWEEIAEDVVAEMGERVGEERPGAHCGSSTCTCTHTEGCEGGWIETGDGTAVVACIFCAPTRSHILGSTHSTMEAGRTLRDTARTSR